MNERIVVLRAEDGVSFVADDCAALAEALNETRPARRDDGDLILAYAELVSAYARLVRPGLVARHEDVRVAVIDHLLVRLEEARAGTRGVPVIDIVDRLPRGELVREGVFA